MLHSIRRNQRPSILISQDIRARRLSLTCIASQVCMPYPEPYSLQCRARASPQDPTTGMRSRNSNIRCPNSKLVRLLGIKTSVTIFRRLIILTWGHHTTTIIAPTLTKPLRSITTRAARLPTPGMSTTATLIITLWLGAIMATTSSLRLVSCTATQQ